MPRDIWWADVIRARRALGARTPAEFAAIAAALGYQVTAEERVVSGAESGRSPADPAGPAPPSPVARPAPDRWRGAVADQDAGDRANLPVLQPVAVEPAGPARPDEGEVLARAAPPAAQRADPRWSLLAPHSAAAITQYLLSRSVAGGEPDIDRALELIGAGRPIVDLPGRPVRTLRFGAQVLVDRAASMEPFDRDQADVVRVVTAVVGAGRTEIVQFADVPSRGAGPGRRWSWSRYEPPAAGTGVLLLTDFGIGGDPFTAHRASLAEWTRFLQRLHRAECRPIALVPYPPARWPRRLLRLCPMITWDRHTTVGHARAVTP